MKVENKQIKFEVSGKINKEGQTIFGKQEITSNYLSLINQAMDDLPEGGWKKPSQMKFALDLIGKLNGMKKDIKVMEFTDKEVSLIKKHVANMALTVLSEDLMNFKFYFEKLEA